MASVHNANSPPPSPPPAASMAGWPMEPPTPGSLEHIDLGSALGEAFTPEMRERMARLEKENEILRRRLAETERAREEGRGGGGGSEGGREGEE